RLVPRPRAISRASCDSSSVSGRTVGRELSARLQPTIRVLRSACILALALGYAAFYSIFPSATFPVSGDASFPWIFVVLAAASVLGGVDAGALRGAVWAAWLALPRGVQGAVLLAFSPAR